MVLEWRLNLVKPGGVCDRVVYCRNLDTTNGSRAHKALTMTATVSCSYCAARFVVSDVVQTSRIPFR